MGGTNSGGGGGKIFRPTKMLVFAMVIVFLTFLRLGIKFSRWGKNSLGGVKIHQVGTSETDTLGPALDIYNSIFLYQYT